MSQATNPAPPPGAAEHPPPARMPRLGRTLIAEATSSPVPPTLEIPGLVTMAEARMAAGRAQYFQDPVFPDCFTCGMNRQPGDGLRIFPGPVPGRGLWAAPWTPNPSVAGTDGRVRPEVA